MRDPLTLSLTLLSVALTAFAQICLKIGVGDARLQSLLAQRAWLEFLPTVLMKPWVMAGLAGYVLSTASWLVVLARAELLIRSSAWLLSRRRSSATGHCTKPSGRRVCAASH